MASSSARSPLVPLLLLASCGTEAEAPELTPIQAEFRGLPSELVPLFVLGDVNQDFRLDSLDLALITRLAESGGQDSSAAACFAAADLTRDGRVDGSDPDAFRELQAALGDSAALPLYAQPYLRCAYRTRMLAAPVEWRRDRPVRLRLLEGRTTDEVALALFGGNAEVEALPTREGWDLRLPVGLDSMALLSIRFSRGDTVLSYTLASSLWLQFAAADTGAGNEPWIESTWTDLDGDGHADDPTGVPPPPAFGEEIAGLTTCPQKGQGCEALVIDFSKHVWYEVDGDYSKEALETVGCNLSYAAPSFVRVPGPIEVTDYRNPAALTVIQPSPAALAQALATNRAAWLEVRAAIARHRAAIPAGKELVIQLVLAHGDDGPRFGSWSPGFSTGAGDMTRRDFHKGNYNVTRGKACHAIALDWSCASGNTPRAIQYLNNTGQAHSFQPEPGINHGFHAAFDADMGSGLLSQTGYCTNGDRLGTDFPLSGVIRRYGRNRDYGRLALLGFRPYLLDESPSKYSDRGYNRGAGSRCEAPSHVRAY